MKRKISILLVVALLFTLVIFGVATWSYKEFAENYFDVIKDLNIIINDPLTPSDLISQYNQEIPQYTVYFVFKTFLYVLTIALPALLLTSLILLNKTELKTFFSRLRSPEKRAAKKEEQRQKKLDKAQKLIEKYSDKGSN